MPDYYGTVEGADTYHFAMGNAAWVEAPSSPPDAKEAALRRASVWLDGEYGERWPGRRATAEQERAWPRVDAEDADGFPIADDVTPLAVIRATYEAAARELAAPGYLNPDYIASEQVVSETVGPISTTYKDSRGGVGDVLPVVTIIDGILAGLIGRRRSSTFLFLRRA